MKTSKAKKYIVGMISTSSVASQHGRVEMFNHPTEHTTLDAAEQAAEYGAKAHNKVFEVFKRVSSFGPSAPPVVKTTYR